MVQQPEHTRKNLVDELQKYFDETPREKVLDDWQKTSDFDSVGITCDEFIEQNDMTEEILKWRVFANDLVSSYLGVTNNHNQAVKCAQISAKKMKEQFEVVGALLPDSNEVVNENIRFITGVCEVLGVKKIKAAIQPHQVFVDEIKNLINAFFVDNNNYEGGHFFNYGGVDAGYRNLVNHNKEYGKYIIDKMESIRHLIEPDAEFDEIDSVTVTI